MYSKKVNNVLKKKRISIGDRLAVKSKEITAEGVLLPQTEAGSPDTLVIKLDTGYNLGVKLEKGVIVKKLGGAKRARLGKLAPEARKKLGKDRRKPSITILHTGGTIASRVSYETGGVVSAFDPKDLLAMFPELFEIANIKTRLVCNIFSEDMTPDHWSLLAREVEKEAKKGIDGIIITHGTDTMHYTAAALAFALENVSLPVILVGAQRSSDRPSSDAALNAASAAFFIAKTDFAGVAICMHANMNDDSCFILQGTKARKMHASRRDAFRPINVLPGALVDFKAGRIKFLRPGYPRKGKGNMVVKPKFSKKVALVKIYPGMNPKVMSSQNCKGIVLEGTGLGHAPEDMLSAIKKFVKAGGVVAMTSQTIYGRTNMNVYETGRKLLDAGVVPCGDMTPEAAYAKLSWLLANKPKKAAELMSENLRGEINERTTTGFLY